MTRHSVAALLEDWYGGEVRHLALLAIGAQIPEWRDYREALLKVLAVVDGVADAIERERGTTELVSESGSQKVRQADPGAGAAAPESPNVEVGPYRAVLDTLVGASDMKLSEALAGTFLLLNADSPHITIPTEAMVTILRAVRAAVVLQERAALRGERSTTLSDDDVKPTRWVLAEADLTQRDGRAIPAIDLMLSPFYDGPRFAVRDAPFCLTIHGEWEYEPLPSSRDDAFYARCRFATLDAAVKALRDTLVGSPAPTQKEK